MKRKLSVFLAFVMLLSILFPINTFAQEDKELEKAITTAKTLLNITDKYDNFTYSISKEQNKTIYNLSWNDTKNKLGSVSATIDNNGRITNYYSYQPYDISASRPKIPLISKEDALKTANDFIKRVNPSIYGKVKCEIENTPMNIYSNSYQFYYYRIENGIPFYQNSVNISIENRTGKVEYFRCSWTDDLIFPLKDSIISLEQAQKIYTEDLGLKLAYKMIYNEEGNKPILVYTNVYSSKAIDAKTGDVIDVNQYYYGRKEMDAGTANKSASGAEQVALTPEEKKAIETAASFVTQVEAENIGRKILGLESGYELNSINLYGNSLNKGDYIWNMYFTKEESGDKVSLNAYISIDAKTGEVLDFYKYVPYDSDAQVIYNKEQALSIAQDYIKSLQPQKISEVEYTDWGESIYKPMGNDNMPVQYSFTFTRKVNNAYFQNNGFNIAVDTKTGAVTNYSFTWYKGELPSADSIITADKAHSIFFNRIGMELQYSANYIESQKTAEEIKPETKLIYAVKQEKQLDIDAVSGELLDYSGSPYVERTISEYSDISGTSFEKQIKILAQFGIALPGSKFMPSKYITQKEFLYLIAKAVDPYTEYKINGDAKDEEKLYEYMINNGIIKKGEKSPGSKVTKEDTAKFIIRVMKYDKIADIKGIYKLSFKDESKIKPELYGYVAIAYGLKIMNVNGKYFSPKSNVTRAQAAEVIYNYLNN